MPAEPAARLAAVTGATGFLGPFLVQALAARGARLRLLVRREQTGGAWSGMEPEIVLGDLDDRSALSALVRGADVVVHAAGLVKALSPEAFSHVNRDGSRRIAEAARDEAPQARFVQVSSLAAREPGLSPYAESKRAGEIEVERVLGGRATIVRPPAIYGPGDVEWAPVFQAAARPFAPDFGRAGARLTLMHVADVAEAVADLALGQARPGTWALSDARPDGYSWREVLEAAAAAQRRRPPRLIPVPAPLLHVAAATAAAAARVRRQPTLLSPGKAREILHADWSLPPSERLPGSPQPRFGLLDGFQNALAVI